MHSLSYPVLIFSLILAGVILFIGGAMYVRWFSTLIRNKGVPTIGTFPRHKHLMKQYLQLKKNARLIDLGCGVGGALRFFADTYTCHQLDGVDLNTIAVHAGNRWNTRKGYTNISLRKQNIFSTDISGYDYVYCFLMPNLMEDVEDFFERRLKSGTTVICLAFRLPNWIPDAIIRDTDKTPKIFLYTKPDKK